ncbi:MAG: HAD family hydrolase [Lachnospiraceae bacterium]
MIASDLDGTLLNENHVLDECTYEVLIRAQKAGMRFIAVTGRDYSMTRDAFEGFDLNCDYILASGAETRNSAGVVVKRLPLPFHKVKLVTEALSGFFNPLSYNTANKDYRVGGGKEVRDGIVYEVRNFYRRALSDRFDEEQFVKLMLSRTTIVPQLEDIEESVYKISMTAKDAATITKMKKVLSRIPGLAVASSFSNNIEITDELAQKGPVLKNYITSLGYTMEEVIAFGDSQNDYSMLSMDFGRTFAMENADPEIKAVAQRIAPSNTDHGVAQVIEELLTGR